MRRALAAVTVVVLAWGVAACGGAAGGGGEVAGNALTIYSSQPLRGPDASTGLSIVRGEKLAISKARGKVGKYTINYISLDDSTETTRGSKPGRSGWDAQATGANATKAGQDPKTIAYIGDFDPEATATAIPITNEAGILQVAPAGGAVGLTKKIPGTVRGAPDIYYPSGERNFARVAPPADLQATAGANWARQLGARRVHVVNDGSAFGAGMAHVFGDAAADSKLTVSGRAGAGPGPRVQTAAEALDKLGAAKPDLIYVGAAASAASAKLLAGVAPRQRQAKLMLPDELLVPSGFGRSLGPAAGRTYVTGATLAEQQLPKAGREFVKLYGKRYGEAPDPYAAYGYAAMQVVLEAIKRAGKKGNDRPSVIGELFEDKPFETVVGSFKFDENGDPQVKSVAGYKVAGGNLKFDRALEGSATD